MLIFQFSEKENCSKCANTEETLKRDLERAYRERDDALAEIRRTRDRLSVSNFILGLVFQNLILPGHLRVNFNLGSTVLSRGKAPIKIVNPWLKSIVPFALD